MDSKTSYERQKTILKTNKKDEICELKQQFEDRNKIIEESCAPLNEDGK